MYTLEIRTQARDDILKLGQLVGAFIQSNDPYVPFAATFGSDTNSGKSLLALAIDNYFRPGFYEHGVTPDHSADDILKRSWDQQTSIPVVFKNFLQLRSATDESFDRTLKKFRDQNFSARAVLASNLQRTIIGQFDYARKGLCSTILDANFFFHIKPGKPFSRNISMTTKHGGLLETIRSNYHACEVA